MTDYRFDLFISHSTKDKPFVRELATRLKADGLSIWFDEWEIKPGDLILKKIEEGLMESRVMVLIMSHNSFDSEWATLESGTFRFRDPTNKGRRFIPLKIDNCEINDALKQFAYIDWTRGQEEQYARLLMACRLVKSSEILPEKSTKDKSLSEYTVVVDDETNKIIISNDRRYALSNNYNSIRIFNIHNNITRAGIQARHNDRISCIAISFDGEYAVTGSFDSTIKLWEVQTGKSIIFNGHVHWVMDVALTNDGNRILSCGDDGTVRVWDVKSTHYRTILKLQMETFYSLAVSSDDSKVIVGGNGSVTVIDLESNATLVRMHGHAGRVNCVAISKDGRWAISGGEDRTVKIWDIHTGCCLATLEGHTKEVLCVAIDDNCHRAISGSLDKYVRAWDVDAGTCLFALEGHASAVTYVSISDDGRQGLSISIDGEIRESFIDLDTIAESSSEFTRYTNAKVLLVGETGVGKTGLAFRLAEDRFQNSFSTDGAWATQLKLPNNINTSECEREIWLWDFAGQADYRLVHQLFMDETALAVLVFNPQNENPFEGLIQWDKDIQQAARRKFNKLLVAGRCDRGGLMISSEKIRGFLNKHNYVTYIETSSLTGSGCDKLLEAIINYIPWSEIPWTASPRIFRQLKAEIIKLKDQGKVLLRSSELKQQLEMSLLEESFTLDELRAVVGLLASPGVVWILEFGDFILLQPDRINAYASAVIRSVRNHSDEIGCIYEEDVLSGKLDYQDMKRLPLHEEQIVLRAMHQTLVDHSLCLREHTENGTLLIFPSYFKRERTEVIDHPSVLVTYSFTGPLDEIYATLIVRLQYTHAFECIKLWRFAADYSTAAGKRLGLKMTKTAEGVAEIQVYFENSVSDDIRVTFIRYVHEHLKLKAQDVVRLRHYICPKCNEPIENLRAVQKRLEKGFKDVLCATCENRVELFDLIEKKFASEDYQYKVQKLEEKTKSEIDNESRELILIGHAFAIAGEAGQIFRPISNSDWGIDGEIEFKDHAGKASGKRIYLQLKSGDSYLHHRHGDGAEIFTIKNARHAEYWQQHEYPVMLVIRKSDGTIRWMDISAYLINAREKGVKNVKQVTFEGAPFTALSLRQLRDRTIDLPLSGKE